MTEPKLYQASCVAIGGRALLIEGPPGSGKSSLALALIDRGAILIGDDGVSLVATDAPDQIPDKILHAAPPPNIAGKLEIRGVGIVDLPSTGAPVALILALGLAGPRFVEQAGMAELCGVSIPRLAFFADNPVAAIRAEYALERHGLRHSGPYATE